MNCTERTMAARTMDLPVTRNSPNCALHEVMHNNVRCEDIRYIGSDELNRLIDEDYHAAWEEDVLMKDLDPASWHLKYEVIKEEPKYFHGDCFERDFLEEDEDPFPYDPLPDAFSIMVNPRTGLLVTHPFSRTESSNKNLPHPVEPQGLRKPYHPSHDHDYMKIIKEDDESDMESSGLNIVEEMFKSKDEPVVEVWEIDNFCKKPDPKADTVPQQSSSYQQTFKETRRTSTRTAEIRRREQARKISNAVHAVLKKDKAQRVRQYKNIKPKNSVETTPSQSDIEEWYSQPVRPTYTKISKKKTSKGRIDHSESERHRREVLRTNFSSLCELIPHDYLRGEKVSSQISKQKILNGAKAYIAAVNKAKSSYKSQFLENSLLREKYQKKYSSKLIKCVKKQK